MTYYSLTNEHFVVAGGPKKTLRLKIQGPCLVLFKMSTCPLCRTAEPTFTALMPSFRSVAFASVDVNTHRHVAKMSVGTTTEISAVPTLLFYASGVPVARFRGEWVRESVSSFISKALQSIPQPQAGGPQGSAMMPPGYNYPPQQSVAPTFQQPPAGPPPPQQRKQFYDTATVNQSLGNADDSDALLLPNNVVPYNTPWEVDFRTMESGENGQL